MEPITLEKLFERYSGREVNRELLECHFEKCVLTLVLGPVKGFPETGKVTVTLKPKGKTLVSRIERYSTIYDVGSRPREVLLKLTKMLEQYFFEFE